MGCTSKMPTGNAPVMGKIFTWVRAQKSERLGADTDIFMAGLTWLFPFKKLPWILEDGNEKIIEKKEKFMETDESIREFFEVKLGMFFFSFDEIIYFFLPLRRRTTMNSIVY